MSLSKLKHAAAKPQRTTINRNEDTLNSVRGVSRRFRDVSAEIGDLPAEVLEVRISFGDPRNHVREAARIIRDPRGVFGDGPADSIERELQVRGVLPGQDAEPKNRLALSSPLSELDPLAVDDGDNLQLTAQRLDVPA